MDRQQKVKVATKKLQQSKHDKNVSLLESFVLELQKTLDKRIEIVGLDSLEDMVVQLNAHSERVSGQVKQIVSLLADVEVDIPKHVNVRVKSDEALLVKLEELKDDGSIVRQLEVLDEHVLLLNKVLSDRQGKRPEDYIPVRIVLGDDSALDWLRMFPAPIFSSGGGSSGGLTDEELRASPVPVEVSGISTEAKQDNIISELETLNSLIPSAYDYIDLSYTGDNLTTVVFKTGGASGTTVSTLTLAYSGSNLTSVTKS